MNFMDDASKVADTLANLLKVSDPRGRGGVRAVSAGRRAVRETPLTTTSLVLGKETKFLSRSQNQ